MEELQQAMSSMPGGEDSALSTARGGGTASIVSDVIGHVPRYAIPSLSSLLPTYVNSEQDFITRTFHRGNYDQIRTLPNTLKEQQVTAARAARQEAASRFLMPALTGLMVMRDKQDNQQGLFSTFEYVASQYDLEDELSAQKRLESEARRVAVSDRHFVPAHTVGMARHEDYDPTRGFPTLGGPEMLDDLRLAERLTEDAKLLPQPFFPSGCQKLDDVPSKIRAWEMMNNLKKWILQDWEGADVSLFENHQDCWVIRIVLATIDSPPGLVAYMNVFVRCNELVADYKLTKVVEFWNTTPGDGCVYYVVRPPWVRQDRIETHFTLHPEERDWRTSFAVVELERSRQATAQ